MRKRELAEIKENRFPGDISVFTAGVAVIVVGLSLWSSVVGLLNDFVYPGYETCKKEISKALDRPDNVEIRYPLRRPDFDAKPGIWNHAIEVRFKSTSGGTSALMIRCDVDMTGQVAKYRIYL